MIKIEKNVTTKRHKIIRVSDRLIRAVGYIDEKASIVNLNEVLSFSELRQLTAYLEWNNF